MQAKNTYGIVTSNPELVQQANDLSVIMYEIKDVLGVHRTPIPGTVSMVSCFSDNQWIKEHPDFVAVSKDGMKATRKEKYFDWDCLCPSRDEWKEKLLRIVKEADRQGEVRLDVVGFPREGFCWCTICQEKWKQSRLEDWEAWRASVITDFVRSCREATKNRLYMTLYPDPLKVHHYHRFGVDIDAVSKYVDCFVIPVYDLHYSVTYWLETLAWGFRDMLKKPFLIELYACDLDPHKLAKATQVARHYADGVLFAYPRNAEYVQNVLSILKKS
ncbi:MAG: hypothetical protein BAA01_10820 [Bacillus thermozeamaize]|uniref:DUF4015 domain-containing protein n=1 Tax=Bacillus thermozeamaize TaxID=230954 RepID=A0A1Y3PUC1_9BACI|nr:MAG: hypothetical protein BAA01_10820 [Bacillus thermozeamaize]